VLKNINNFRPAGKPPPNISKLKLLIPELGSGEIDAVITAVDAICLCLQRTGHTFDDLADLLVLPTSGAHPPVTHRDFARKILAEHSADLEDYELKFVQVMSRSPRCTERQARWLNDLYCRFF
jgi:hypothetical protein